VYWSIYDVLMLVSGLITLVIVIAPVEGIAPRTRFTAGAIGGGLVFLSLLLASIPAFRYPGVVMVAPVIALLGVVAVIGKAVRGQTSLQVGQQGHSMSQSEPEGHTDLAVNRIPTESTQRIPTNLSSTELMQLAQRDHGRWAEIAQHPSAYPALLEWLNQYGSAEVKAAVAARRLLESRDPN
jgi:hypothetical protein